MLNLNSCKPLEIIERPIVTGETIGAEGIPLTSVLEDGEEKVKACTGAATDILCGFSWQHNILPQYLTRVETYTIPAVPGPYTVQLDRGSNVNGQISVMCGAVQWTEGGLATTVYVHTHATGLLTFHQDDAGKTVVVSYKYEPTVSEAKMLWPETDIAINPAFEFLGSLGVVRSGIVYTDQFDCSSNWAATPATIYLGTGILTKTAGTSPLIMAHVIHVPNEANPFLGVSFQSGPRT